MLKTEKDNQNHPRKDGPDYGARSLIGFNQESSHTNGFGRSVQRYLLFSHLAMGVARLLVQNGSQRAIPSAPVFCSEYLILLSNAG